MNRRDVQKGRTYEFLNPYTKASVIERCVESSSLRAVFEGGVVVRPTGEFIGEGCICAVGVKLVNREVPSTEVPA